MKTAYILICKFQIIFLVLKCIRKWHIFSIFYIILYWSQSQSLHVEFVHQICIWISPWLHAFLLEVFQSPGLLKTKEEGGNELE